MGRVNWRKDGQWEKILQLFSENKLININILGKREEKRDDYTGDVIYFQVNNSFLDWNPYVDYPNDIKFEEWVPFGSEFTIFDDHKYVEENRLCVVRYNITFDEFVTHCITAPREWVDANCPSLLDASNKKYLYHPNDYNIVFNEDDAVFLSYTDGNIGIIDDREYEYE